MTRTGCLAAFQLRWWLHAEASTALTGHDVSKLYVSTILNFLFETPLAKTNLAGAAADVDPLSSRIPVQETIETDLKKSVDVQPAKIPYLEPSGDGLNSEIQEQSELSKEEDHQWLLERSLLLPEISSKILNFLGTKDLRSASQFVYFSWILVVEWE